MVFGSPDHVNSIALSVDLYNVDDPRADELSLEFKIVSSPLPAIFNFRATYRTKNLPLKGDKSTSLLVTGYVSLPYSSTERIKV
jgi:hypothetical protein